MPAEADEDVDRQPHCLTRLVRRAGGNRWVCSVLIFRWLGCVIGPARFSFASCVAFAAMTANVVGRIGLLR